MNIFEGLKIESVLFVWMKTSYGFWKSLQKTLSNEIVPIVPEAACDPENCSESCNDMYVHLGGFSFKPWELDTGENRLMQRRKAGTEIPMWLTEQSLELQ